MKPYFYIIAIKILILISRVVTPCVLCICFVFNLFGFIRIKCQRQAISPLVVHDRSPADETMQWASQIRYNKALFTNAASPIFCIFLVVGIYITTDYAMSFPIGINLRTYICWNLIWTISEMLSKLTYLHYKLNFRTERIENPSLFLHANSQPHDFHSNGFLHIFIGLQKTHQKSLRSGSENPTSLSMYDIMYHVSFFKKNSFCVMKWIKQVKLYFTKLPAAVVSRIEDFFPKNIWT